MFSVYLLISEYKNHRYVGMTNDPDRRLREHNAGQVKSTAPYAPFQMILLRTHEHQYDARKSEKYYKSGFGRKAIDRLLNKSRPA